MNMNNQSIKLIHRAYLYLIIGHEGFGESVWSDSRAGIKFFIKTSNRSRKWSFGIGHREMRIFILIKASATIRNFTVPYK